MEALSLIELVMLVVMILWVGYLLQHYLKLRHNKKHS